MKGVVFRTRLDHFSKKKLKVLTDKAISFQQVSCEGGWHPADAIFSFGESADTSQIRYPVGRCFKLDDLTMQLEHN